MCIRLHLLQYRDYDEYSNDLRKSMRPSSFVSFVAVAVLGISVGAASADLRQDYYNQNNSGNLPDRNTCISNKIKANYSNDGSNSYWVNGTDIYKGEGYDLCANQGFTLDGVSGQAGWKLIGKLNQPIYKGESPDDPRVGGCTQGSCPTHGTWEQWSLIDGKLVFLIKTILDGHSNYSTNIMREIRPIHWKYVRGENDYIMVDSLACPQGSPGCG